MQLQLQASSKHKSRLTRAIESENRKLQKAFEQMTYAEELQRDYDRRQISCGLAPGFAPVVLYGRGLSPLSLPNSATLRSWHASSLGLTMGTGLVATLFPADPAIVWDADLNQNLAPRVDITTGGQIGVGSPQYGITLDGGLSYFQSGPMATLVPVPLLGRTLIMSNSGPYTLGNQFNCVCKTIANQTSQPGTLNGAPTDSSKPVVSAKEKNGYPALLGTAGTTGGLTDNTSSLASDVTSGGSFAVFFAGATPTAVPSSIINFWSFGNASSANQAYSFGIRNGSGALRAQRINDTGAPVSFREASVATTAYLLYTFLFDANNVTVRVNGTTIVNNLSLGTGATTCNAFAYGCLYRNSAQTNAMAFKFLEETAYSTGSAADWTASNLSTVESYFITKYAL